MRPETRCIVLMAACAASLLAAGTAPGADAPSAGHPPVAARHPVTNSYFDTTVRDDYQWMESWADTATRAWVAGQNAWTRARLDREPARPAIRDRIEELTRSISPDYSGLVYRGGVLFALKDQPPKNQDMLVALASVDDLS